MIRISNHAMSKFVKDTDTNYISELIEPVYLVKDPDDLQSLMTEFKLKGYSWKSNDPSFDPTLFNPWDHFVDADALLIFVDHDNKITYNPLTNDEVRELLSYDKIPEPIVNSNKYTMYHVLQSDRLDILEKLIITAFRDGWSCQGGINTCINALGYHEFYQAMIK